MDKDEIVKTFWYRVGLRQYELNLTATRIQQETKERTGKTYRLIESKCRNVLPDSYSICVLAEILKTTTDYLLGFTDSSGSVTATETKILTMYREDRHFKVIVDNLLEFKST